MEFRRDKMDDANASAQAECPDGKIRSSSKIRRIAARVAMLVASFLVAVGLCELGLWLFAPISFHEWMIWESQGHIRARPMPNQVFHTATGAPVRINKDGFRGPDYPYEKPSGTLRVEVFGGSAGFCYHAEGRGSTWPGVLERELGHRLSMPVEVINLSLPGFDVFHSKINYLCYGRAFRPDVIVVYHTWNDMKMFRSLAKRPYRSVTYVPHKPLWERIARETQIGRRARNFFWTIARTQMENEYVDGGGPSEWENPIDERAFDWERTNFRDFVQLPSADGVLSVLVSQASLYGPDNLEDPDVRFSLAANPKFVGMNLPLIRSTWLRIASIIEEVAAEYGAIFVDGYNAVPHEAEYVRDAVHLEDAGSEVLGTAIADTLVADDRFLKIVERVRAEPESPDE